MLRLPHPEENHVMKKDHASWILVLFLTICAPLAAKESGPAIKKADTPEKLEIVITAIRQEMVPGGRYEYLNGYNRRVVDDSLDHMQEMLVKAGSVDAMSQEQKTELFSYQERANGILAKNAADRLICQHAPPTGSHIPMTQCKTFRELTQRRTALKRKTKEMQDTSQALDAQMGDGGSLPMGLNGGRDH
jgi:hypothetical protein